MTAALWVSFVSFGGKDFLFHMRSNILLPTQSKLQILICL